jgi:hypothetical protein
MMRGKFASMGEYGGRQCEGQSKVRRGAERVGAPVLGEYGGHVGAPVTK